MKTPIAIIRKAASTRGGLAKASDAQLHQWWRSLDNLTREQLRQQGKGSREQAVKTETKEKTETK